MGGELQPGYLSVVARINSWEPCAPVRLNSRSPTVAYICRLSLLYMSSGHYAAPGQGTVFKQFSSAYEVLAPRHPSRPPPTRAFPPPLARAPEHKQIFLEKSPVGVRQSCESADGENGALRGQKIPRWGPTGGFLAKCENLPVGKIEIFPKLPRERWHFGFYRYVFPYLSRHRGPAVVWPTAASTPTSTADLPSKRSLMQGKGQHCCGLHCRFAPASSR